MLTPGTLLQDRFEIVREIGRGGMGAVFELTSTGQVKLIDFGLSKRGGATSITGYSLYCL